MNSATHRPHLIVEANDPRVIAGPLTDPEEIKRTVKFYRAANPQWDVSAIFCEDWSAWEKANKRGI